MRRSLIMGLLLAALSARAHQSSVYADHSHSEGALQHGHDPSNAHGCDVSTWGDWSVCSTSCGRGMESRYRTVTPPHIWSDCPPQAESRECFVNVTSESCPVDCLMSNPTGWSECSRSCGTGPETGFRMRRRSILREPMYGGRACQFNTTEIGYCPEVECPIDCQMGPWTELGACDTTCGPGFRKFTRLPVVNASFGGAVCPSETEKLKECNNGECVQACEVSNWTIDLACTRTCGNGYQKHVRHVITQAQHGGASCPVLVKYSECNTEECPIDCVVSEFTGFGACSATCGGGSKVKHRSALVSNAYGGVPCPDLTVSEPCSDDVCPVDCVMESFGNWSTCSKSCGGGTTTRSRQVATPASHGGKHCPFHHEVKQCNKHFCPIDCVMSNFSEWQTCSHSCGGGTQIKTRSIRQPHMYGGLECPPVEDHTQLRSCNTWLCPVDCQLTSWTDWSTCTKSCSGGSQSRSRMILQKEDRGAICPAVDAQNKTWTTQPCNTHCCGGEGWSTADLTCKTCEAGKHSNNNVCEDCPYGSYSAAGSSECPPKGPVGDIKIRLTFSATSAALENAVQTVLSSIFNIPRTDVAIGAGSGTLLSAADAHLDVTMKFPDMAAVENALSILSNTASFLSALEGGLANAGFNVDCSMEVVGEHYICVLGVSDIDVNITAPGHTAPPTPAPTPFPTPAPTCSDGSFADANATDGCTECAAGRYLHKNDDHWTQWTCAPCAAGYGSEIASTECQICPAGHYSPGDSTCIPCSDGHFQLNAGGAKCNACALGRFSNDQVGLQTCSICPKGHFADATGASACKTCPTNYYSREEQASCSQCPYGKFHVVAYDNFVYETGWSGERCLDYPVCGLGKQLAGHTTDSAGQCADCNEDQYQPEPNQWDAPCLSCGECALGHERNGCDVGSAGTCEPCQIGTFKNDATNQACQICPAGTFTPSTKAAECLSCPAGYISNQGAGSCNACPAGTANAQDSNTCLQCSAGEYSGVGSPICGTCPDGYYSDAGDPSCTACGIGTFGQGAVKDSNYCVGCPSGKFQSASGMTECQNCAPGQYSNPSSNTMDRCVDCQPGKYQNLPESAACKSCIPGKFNLQLGQANCSYCPACPLGKDYRKGCGGQNAGSCTECPDGTFSEIWKCGDHEACPIGKFGAKHEEVCHICPSGKYKDTESTAECSSCEACPAGHMRVGCTSESAGECVACGHGTYKSASEDWDSGCLVCNKGSYASEQAARSCTACSPGRYQDGTDAAAASACEQCEPGTAAGQAGTVACTICQQGTFQKNYGGTKCTECAQGRYNEVERSTTDCKTCPNGKYHITTDLQCTDCGTGKYLDQIGTASDPNTPDPCKVCPGGKFAAAPATGQCEHCLAGQYETGTRTECMHCPKGQFQMSDLQLSCVHCESGKHMASTGSALCINCPSPYPVAMPTWPVQRHWWTRDLPGAEHCEKKPLDCVPNTWSAWGACSKSCGGGTQSRSRTKYHDGWAGGTPCQNFHWSEESQCNTFDCPIDCEVSSWEGWEMCTAPCGTGHHTRDRAVLVEPNHGGVACPALRQKKKCNEQKCTCKAMTCQYMEHPGMPGVYSIHVTHGIGKTSTGKAHGMADDYFTNDGIHHCKYDRVSETCECTCPGLFSESYAMHRNKVGVFHPGRAVFSPTDHNHTKWAMPQHVWPEWHEIKHEKNLHGSTSTYTWRAQHVPTSVAYRDRLAKEPTRSYRDRLASESSE